MSAASVRRECGGDVAPVTSVSTGLAPVPVSVRGTGFAPVPELADWAAVTPRDAASPAAPAVRSGSAAVVAAGLTGALAWGAPTAASALTIYGHEVPSGDPGASFACGLVLGAFTATCATLVACHAGRRGELAGGASEASGVSMAEDAGARAGAGLPTVTGPSVGVGSQTTAGWSAGTGAEGDDATSPSGGEAAAGVAGGAPRMRGRHFAVAPQAGQTADGDEDRGVGRAAPRHARAVGVPVEGRAAAPVPGDGAGEGRGRRFRGGWHHGGVVIDLPDTGEGSFAAVAAAIGAAGAPVAAGSTAVPAGTPVPVVGADGAFMPAAEPAPTAESAPEPAPACRRGAHFRREDEGADARVCPSVLGDAGDASGFASAEDETPATEPVRTDAPRGAAAVPVSLRPVAATTAQPHDVASAPVPPQSAHATTAHPESAAVFAQRLSERAHEAAARLATRFEASRMGDLPVIERADGTVADMGEAWWDGGVASSRVVSGANDRVPGQAGVGEELADNTAALFTAQTFEEARAARELWRRAAEGARAADADGTTAMAAARASASGPMGAQGGSEGGHAEEAPASAAARETGATESIASAPRTPRRRRGAHFAPEPASVRTAPTYAVAARPEPVSPGEASVDASDEVASHIERLVLEELERAHAQVETPPARLRTSKRYLRVISGEAADPTRARG